MTSRPPTGGPAAGRGPLRWLLLAAGVVFVGWLVAAYGIAPRLIRSAYAGESLPIFNRLIGGQGRNDVDVYLTLWSARARQGTLLLGAALLGGLALVAFRGPADRLRRRLLQSGPTVGFGTTLVVAAWVGLLWGLLEALGLAFKVRSEGIFEYWSNPDFWWMTPTASAVLSLGVAGTLFLLAGGRRGGLSLRVIVLVLVAIGTWSAVRALQLGIHSGILWILAAGLGVHLSRAGLEEPQRVLRVVRATTPPLALGVLALFLLHQPLERWRSARGLEALPAAPRGAPSILLLVLDTVRPQNLSLYGYVRATTPGLEALAARGQVWDRAFSTAPWTLPSHAAMMTGHGYSDQSGNWAAPLDDTHPTLAELLSQRGYASGGFVGNLLYTSRASGIDRGFLTYVDHPPNWRTWLYSQRAMFWLVNKVRERIPGGRVGFDRKLAYEVNDEFLAWVDDLEAERPFFGFLNYFDAHMPYEYAFLREAAEMGVESPRDSVMVEPGRWRALTRSEQQEVDMYDGSILSMDRAFARLLEELDRRGRLENTIVVVTADHGEHFHERSIIDHANSLYTPLVHVPLLLAGPGVPEGLRSEATATLKDLPATVLALLGEENVAFPGHSLLAPRPGPQTALSEAMPSFLVNQVGPIRRGPMKSIVVDNLHYILNGDGVEELYDLATDPWEERDLIAVDTLAARLPGLRAHLRAALVKQGAEGSGSH
ncbi:MAG: sulfatase [Gemmatimonadota bacterium]|nr:sulfatase [Gemmatimonadota bacterium]